MIAEISELTDITLSRVLLDESRTEPQPIRGMRIAKAIESLGLPDIESDVTLLVGYYYYELGAQRVEKEMTADFGADIVNKLGITFAKRGTNERPGMNTIADKMFNLYPDYQTLRKEVGRLHPATAEFIAIQ